MAWFSLKVLSQNKSYQKSGCSTTKKKKKKKSVKRLPGKGRGWKCPFRGPIKTLRLQELNKPYLSTINFDKPLEN